MVQFLVLILVPLSQVREHGPRDQEDQPPSPESEILTLLAIGNRMND